MIDLVSLLVPASAPATANAPPAGSTPVDAAAFTNALQQAMGGARNGTLRGGHAVAPALGQPLTDLTLAADAQIDATVVPSDVLRDVTALEAEAAAPQTAASTMTPPLAAGTAAHADTPLAAAPASAAAAATASISAPAITAATARARVGATDPNRPTSRSLDTLDVEFRTRLERVIGRVERELGYEVRVLETYRAPERQDVLYEQGRTTPGSVVTWTRNSLHTQGRATDLQLVGAGENPNAYARLGAIAAEEGLRTLGPRDPGHVELPRGATAAERTAAPAPATATASDSVDANRRIMEIARSAGRAVPRAQDVATYVQEVARTALAAGRSAAPRATPPTAPSVPTAAVKSPVAGTPAVNASSTPTAAMSPLPAAVGASAQVAPQRPAALRAVGDEVHGAEPVSTAGPVASVEWSMPPVRAVAPASSASSRQGEERTAQDGAAQSGGNETAAPVSPPTAELPVAPVTTAAPETGRATASVQPVREAAGPDVASRIERVVALQEALASQPVHSMLLRLDHENAPLAQIRVGVRGGEVMAALDVADSRLAETLRADMPELQRALERQGLDTGRSDALRVLSGIGGDGTISTQRSSDSGSSTRQGSEQPFRQSQGGQRDPQQRSRGQQREQKEQP